MPIPYPHGREHGGTQGDLVLEEQLRVYILILGLAWAFKTSNKAMPPNTYNPFKQFHALVTKHSKI